MLPYECKVAVSTRMAIEMISFMASFYPSELIAHAMDKSRELPIFNRRQP
jgi:hypothetical protein